VVVVAGELHSELIADLVEGNGSKLQGKSAF